MLFVHGREASARALFRDSGRADWSSAFALVLEKHGFLDVEVRGADEVSPAVASRHSCVVVAHLPAADWTQELVSLVLEREVPALVEGPLPPVLREAVGITGSAGAPADDLTITVLDDALRQRAQRLGMNPGGRMSSPVARPVQRDPALEWSALGVPIGHAQAEAWAAPGWEAERWLLGPDAAVLAEWTGVDSADAYPAVVRVGRLTVCSVGLLGYLGQAHTAPPPPAGAHLTSPRAMPVETLVLGLVDEMHAIANVPRARVLPWPNGKRWALNVRHDFDRFLPPSSVAGVLARHREAGTSSTWYWRSRHLSSGGRLAGRRRRREAARALRVVASVDDHEVALHTERPWCGAEEEQRLVEAAAGHGVRGTSAHGDPNCFRFQGAASVLWAARRGLLYTELIQHAHLHPHRFAWLDAEGLLTRLDVVCLPHHESFDLSMDEGDTGALRVLRMVETFQRARGLMQVMNHPDLNVLELFETLAELPSEGRWDCTASAAAEWWKRTHSLERVTVRAEGSNVRIESRESILGLGLEVLLPSGRRLEATLDVEPDRPALVHLDQMERSD